MTDDALSPRTADTINRQAVIDTIAGERLNEDTCSEGDAELVKETPIS